MIGLIAVMMMIMMMLTMMITVLIVIVMMMMEKVLIIIIRYNMVNDKVTRDNKRKSVTVQLVNKINKWSKFSCSSTHSYFVFPPSFTELISREYKRLPFSFNFFYSCEVVYVKLGYSTFVEIPF
jgi:hypothetical protein